MQIIKLRSEILKAIDILELKLGDNLVNLGKVLEIDELPNAFMVVISRMNEKQVFKFLKNQQLVISNSQTTVF